MNRSTINHFKTAMLFVAPAALIAVMGCAVAGWAGLIVSAGAYTSAAAIVFFRADRMVLKQLGAEYIPKSHAPGLYALLSELACRAELSVAPLLYLLPETAPQMLVTGRKAQRGAIALSKGLLELLSTEELAAVIAHAIDHLRCGETRPMTMVAGLVGGLISLSKFFRWNNLLGSKLVSREMRDGVPLDAFLWVLIRPIAAALVRSTVYPSRQFRADAASAHLIGDANPLCKALRKIEAGTPNVAPESVSPSTTHLFLCSPTLDSALHLFQAHPPIIERLHRLEELGRSIRFFQRVTKPSRQQIKTNIFRERQTNI